MKPFLFLTVLFFIFVNILTAADSPNPAIEKRSAEIMPFLPEKPFCVGKPITDRAAWENIPVITYGAWKQKETDNKIELVIGAEGKAVCITVSATNDGKVLPLKLEPLEINEDAMARKKPTRLGFKIDTPVKKATVVMTIMPQLSTPFNL